MSCKLSNNITQGIIEMKDLPFGKLAVLEFEPFEIVTKDRDGSFIILGNPSNSSFAANCNLKVRILQSGEKIEVAYD